MTRHLRSAPHDDLLPRSRPLDPAPPSGRTARRAPDHDAGPSPRVDIVVVHYETPQLLRACLRSIEECVAGTSLGRPADQRVVGDVIVVDNSLSESSVELAREPSRQARLLRPGS